MAGRIFIASVGFVLYTYVGYPLVCWLRARLLPRAIARRAIRPSVSVVIAAFREAETIGVKLQNLSRQSYPAELVQVIVACDGSDDGTPGAAQYVGQNLFGTRLVVLDLPRAGKAAALNAAVRVASGEVLVFTDARQAISHNAIEALVSALGDPGIGAVGGELELVGDAPVSTYWRFESWLRRLQSRAASTVGLSGALYAIRHRHFSALPERTILDDVLIPMRARLAGQRVVVEPAARAYDRTGPASHEFRRKVRTLAGNFQLLALQPSLLSPTRNRSWFDFVSHKVCRLLVPYALLAALFTSAFLSAPWLILLFGGQLLAYGAAALRAQGELRGSRAAALCETLVVLNAAAVAGLLRFVREGRRLSW